MKHKLAPSLLAANFLQLEKDVEVINQSAADWLHIDIMDGIFVPNISFGQNIVKQVSSISTLPLDVHLMIERPSRYIEEFRECGAEIITVHYEACTHLHRTVQQIKNCGAKAGVALNPHSSVNLLEDVLEELDMVLIMSVNPGYGGQKFIYQSLEKVRRLKERLISRNLDTLIEIDGGVGLQNAEACLQAGVDVLVAGSSVFKSAEPAETIMKMKEIGSDTFIV